MKDLGITKEEFRADEDYYDPKLNEDDEVILTPTEERFVINESNVYGVDSSKLRDILKKYKKEHGKVI